MSFAKFGNKYWTDCAGNKSKPGYHFAFYDKKDKVDIYPIHNILSPTEQPADMDWKPEKPNEKNILCFGKRLMTIPWEEWKNGIGKGAPYTVGNYRMNQTTTCPGFDCTRFIYAESAIKEDEEDEEEALIIAEMERERNEMEAKMAQRLKEAKAKKQLKNVEALITQQVDNLLRIRKIRIDKIEKQNIKILEIDTKIEAVKRGDYNAELIRRATLTPK